MAAMFVLIEFLIDLTLFLLTPLGGAYRVVAYKPRMFGDRGAGVAAVGGVAIAYPAWYFRFGDPDAVSGFGWSWLALALATYVQMMAQWCSALPPRAGGRSHCWLGRGEPVLAVALGGAAQAACGAGAFFVLGYASSLAQNLAFGSSDRCLGLTAEELGRIDARFRAAGGRMSGLARLVARTAAGGVGRTASAGGGLGLRVARRLLVKPAPAVATQPTVLGRFARFMGWNMVFHTITSVVGVNLLAVPLVLILLLMGFKVEFPERFKEMFRGFVASAKEMASDGKDALKEKVSDGREEIRERFDRGKEAIREGFAEHEGAIRERIDRGKEALGDEFERRGRRAMRGAIFGGED